jgi:5'-methylthioadenosine phosphorylase/purine-nucleoside phosphorylase
MLGFTGTFEGRPISVQSTGMGCPSCGIVFEELVQLGATRLIRVGTCGGLQTGMQMADVVIGSTASADDRSPIRVAQMDGWAPAATFGLAARAVELAAAAGLTAGIGMALGATDKTDADHRGGAGGARVHVGPIVTSGVFYDPDPSTFSRWKRLGHLGVEMEAAMLYTIAAVNGLEALTILTVSDVIDDDGHTERISDEALRRGVDDMTRLACRVAVS